METALIILVAIAVIVNVIFAVIFLRKRGSGDAETAGASGSLQLLLQQMNELNRTVDRKVGDLTKTVDTKIHQSSTAVQESVRAQLTESARLIREVTQGLTKLDETNRQVVSFADQLQNLQDILKNPKHRGILGEYYLETLLKNVLPPGQYQMQYAFKNGEVVDAAVFVKDKVIPIDSKFSLENYNKIAETRDQDARERLERDFVSDLKLRIQETAKYIRPAEGTMDFAFMFIPHEAIYYDLLVNKVGGAATLGDMEGETDNLIQRAASKYKVIIVSPTSFLAYLQTVLQGLKALQIEETAKDIIKRVGELGTHLNKYAEYHKKLGVSLGTVFNHYSNSSKEFMKMDKDVLRITGEAAGLKVPALEKPEVEE